MRNILNFCINFCVPSSTLKTSARPRGTTQSLRCWAYTNIGHLVVRWTSRCSVDISLLDGHLVVRWTSRTGLHSHWSGELTTCLAMFCSSRCVEVDRVVPSSLTSGLVIRHQLMVWCYIAHMLTSNIPSSNTATSGLISWLWVLFLYNRISTICWTLPLSILTSYKVYWITILFCSHWRLLLLT